MDSAPLYGELDIVVAANANGSNLTFLDTWRQFFEPYHIIVVQSGTADGQRPLQVPEGFDHQIITRNDIKRLLGPKAGCISSQER